jgi:hypothetical protein
MSKARKLLLIAALGTGLFAVGASNAVAQSGDFRLGLEFGNPHAVLIVRPAPFDFRVGYNFTAGSEFLYLSADYRIVDALQIIDFVHLFLGVGAYAQFGATNPFQLGARVPFGLQVFLIDRTLEFFVEAAPVVQFVPSIGFNLASIQGWVGFTVRVPKFWE